MTLPDAEILFNKSLESVSNTTYQTRYSTWFIEPEQASCRMTEQEAFVIESNCMPDTEALLLELLPY